MKSRDLTTGVRSPSNSFPSSRLRCQAIMLSKKEKLDRYFVQNHITSLPSNSAGSLSKEVLLRQSFIAVHLFRPIDPLGIFSIFLSILSNFCSVA